MNQYTKAIVSGIGGAASFVELWLAPHSLGWIIVGAILAAGTTAGVWALPNKPVELPTGQNMQG